MTAGRTMVVGYTRARDTSRGARRAAGSSRSKDPREPARRPRRRPSRAHLDEPGLDVHVTREPGGTWLGERLREVLLARTDAAAPTDPLTDALLFNAARRQLVTEVIRPALDGRPDRSSARASPTRRWPTRATAPGVPLDALRALEAAATDGLKPDLTILLDLPVEDGLARKAPGDVTRFEAEFDLAFHRRVRDGFLALAAAEPGRFAVVDAGSPPADVARCRRRRGRPAGRLG